MAKTEKKTEKKTQVLEVSPPDFKFLTFRITGTAPYVQNKFSNRARGVMRETQEAGSTSRGKKKRVAKDFKGCYEDSMYKTAEGWRGLPASAFRNAIISACRVVGYKMTHAKLAVFIEADGFDEVDGTPLVKITKGKPKYAEHPVRLATGVIDLRARAMWDAGWQAKVRIKYDAGMFTATDITNLMHRVGVQVGIGEGRPDSKNSCGMGWGTFSLEEDKA